MNYYSHHIGDFDRATRHLTRIERSIYRDLLDVYYDTEQPLVLDQAALCRKVIARTNEEATSVEQVLREFFIETPAGWYHDRCEEELDAYRASTSQKSAAGKASAAKRAAKRQQAINGNPTTVEAPLNGCGTALQLTNNQDPLTKNQLKTIGKSPAAEDLDFLEAWAAYPKRPGANRADALKAWSARRKEGVSPELMLAGVRKYAAYVLAESTAPQFIKQAGTFFGPARHFESDWTSGGTGGNSKFNFADLDRSGDVRAMEASMKRHGIDMVTDCNEEVEI